MGQALYRKHRSKKLSEIVGQEHITKTLENALKTGKISHAYLFTGPRGVGKTSIARILAHEINGLPYTDESMHLDIIEIDAASNRRIDEIRDLREKVHIAPTSAKYKVYIIDEVHMLTREAFNALLKTLEEPPVHVVFILATTELHKLPETIISRTQRFTFKAIEPDQAVRHLKAIADQEKINITDDALQILAAHGRGSFRDSISLLDQVGTTSQKITAEVVERLIGVASATHIQSLLNSTYEALPADIIASIDALVGDGVSPTQAARQLATELRKRLIENGLDDVSMKLLGDLLNVPASPEPAGALEIALFQAHLALQYTSQPAKMRNNIQTAAVAASQPVIKQQLAEEAPKDASDTPVPSRNEAQPEDASEPAPDSAASGEIAEWWQDVLTHIKTINNTLYGVLRMAEPREDNETLHLSFGFGFHKKKAADPTTQVKIHEAIKQVTGRTYTINTVHDKNMTKNQQHSAAAQPSALLSSETALPETKDISSVTNIFGGGEVLES